MLLSSPHPCHPRRSPHPFSFHLRQREINYKLLADGISTRERERERNVGFPRLPARSDEICLLVAADIDYGGPESRQTLLPPEALIFCFYDNPTLTLNGAQKMNKEGNEGRPSLIHTHENNRQQRIIAEESVQTCFSIRPKSAFIPSSTSPLEP